MMTIDLRNLNVDMLINHHNMKPKRNPIQVSFVDDYTQVFKKFNFKDCDKLINGGHNTIYINNDFTLRISRLIFKPENETFNYDIHMNETQKMKDEDMLRKAIKYKISPRVYLFSNIKINDNIHRYCVMESYTTCLTKFIKRVKFKKVLETPECLYKAEMDIYEDIASQIVDICQRIIDINVVYYDFKSDNIVVNIDEITGKITLNMIDWDSEFCVEEYFLKGNEDAVLFLNLCICGYYMYIYCRFNILYKEIQKRYTTEIIEKIIKLIVEYDNEYITIILHYFHTSFDMTFNEVKNFDIDDIDQKDRLIHVIRKRMLYYARCLSKNDISNME
jgi:hypothetical protein